MNELYLYNVPLPEATDTYVPIPHEYLIEKIVKELQTRNLSVKNKQYMTSHEGRRLIGYFDVSIPNSLELGLRIAFRNSYDKSMSIAIVTGAQVWICSNGMVRGDGVKFIRRHTGNVLEEVDNTISESIAQLEDKIIEYIELAQRMKEIEVSKEEAAFLYGKAFFIHNLFNLKQLQLIKNELSNPSYEDFKEDSLWSIYNHVTYVLKKNTINNYFQQHVKWHRFIEDEYNLGGISD